MTSSDLIHKYDDNGMLRLDELSLESLIFPFFDEREHYGPLHIWEYADRHIVFKGSPDPSSKLMSALIYTISREEVFKFRIKNGEKDVLKDSILLKKCLNEQLKEREIVLLKLMGDDSSCWNDRMTGLVLDAEPAFGSYLLGQISAFQLNVNGLKKIYSGYLETVTSGKELPSPKYAKDRSKQNMALLIEAMFKINHPNEELRKQQAAKRSKELSGLLGANVTFVLLDRSIRYLFEEESR